MTGCACKAAAATSRIAKIFPVFMTPPLSPANAIQDRSGSSSLLCIKRYKELRYHETRAIELPCLLKTAEDFAALRPKVICHGRERLYSAESRGWRRLGGPLELAATIQTNYRAGAGTNCLPADTGSMRPIRRCTQNQAKGCRIPINMNTGTYPK